MLSKMSHLKQGSNDATCHKSIPGAANISATASQTTWRAARPAAAVAQSSAATSILGAPAAVSSSADDHQSSDEEEDDSATIGPFLVLKVLKYFRIFF